MASLPTSRRASFSAVPISPVSEHESFIDGFKRLAIGNSWTYGSKIYRESLVGAMNTRFNTLFQDLGTTVEGWQKLCRAVGMAEKDIPWSITKCKKHLERINVNIFDLEDALSRGEVARTFKTERKLADYSKMHKLVYPIEDAKQNVYLRFMLRNIRMWFNVKHSRKGK